MLLPPTGGSGGRGGAPAGPAGGMGGIWCWNGGSTGGGALLGGGASPEEEGPGLDMDAFLAGGSPSAVEGGGPVELELEGWPPSLPGSAKSGKKMRR